MRSPDVIAVRRTPLHPLLGKELRGIISGRALWTMLLIMCPIVGFSFFQAVSLYGQEHPANQVAEQPIWTYRPLIDRAAASVQTVI